MSIKLLVKNFPSKFTEQDKHDFLQLFGTTHVTCMYGKLKNSCFIEFADTASAQQGLDVLHQFEILGQRLVAEYAKPAHEKEANEIQSKKVIEKDSFISDKNNQPKQQNIDTINKDHESLLSGVAPNLGMNHNFPAHLHYRYPEPNITILTNIANALASVPKFYTLVLHLMNKLNLPPPFTGVTPSPPLPDDNINLQDACVDTSDLCNFVSSDESELESDSETQKHEIYQHNQVTNEPIRKRKRLRAAAPKDQEKFHVIKTKHSDLPVESAFDLTSSVKRMEFKLGNSIKSAVDKNNSPVVHYNIFDERGQFGKLKPIVKDTEQNEEEDEEDEEEELEEEVDEDDVSEYVSLKQLKENKIPSVDILAMNQFKNYKEGEKTNRLYIKNIGKQVTSEDLLFVFKRFTRKCSEEEKSTLDIRLMKEGRMKGQAFVTFPNEDIAETALRSVHGYVLQEKPMVIQYGKSGK